MPFVQSVHACVCLGHFKNIDVYQRGLYKIQLRLYKRSSPCNQSSLKDSAEKRIDALPIRTIKLEEFLQHPVLEHSWDPRYHIFPPHTLELTSCPLNNHKKCTWRCSPHQTFQIQPSTQSVVNPLQSATKHQSMTSGSHSVFASNTFNLTTQGETIPLLCGTIFELHDMYYDTQAFEEDTCAYLEVQLYFLSDGESNDPDMLQLQQTRTIRLNDIMSIRANSLHHHIVTFDGTFFSNCDIVIATSPMGFDIQTEDLLTGLTSKSAARASLTGTLLTSIAGALGSSWPLNAQTSDFVTTSRRSLSNTNIKASSTSTPLQQISQCFLSNPSKSTCLSQFLTVALGCIWTLFDLYIYSSELMQGIQKNIEYAAPVKLIHDIIRASLPRMDEDRMPSTYQIVDEVFPVFSRLKQITLMSGIGTLVRKWITIERKNQTEAEISCHLFNLINSLKPLIQEAWKSYIDLSVVCLFKGLLGLRTIYTLGRLERMHEKINNDQLESSLEFLANSRKKSIFLEDYPTDRHPLLTDLQKKNSHSMPEISATPQSLDSTSNQSISKLNSQIHSNVSLCGDSLSHLRLQRAFSSLYTGTGFDELLTSDLEYLSIQDFVDMLGTLNSSSEYLTKLSYYLNQFYCNAQPSDSFSNPLLNTLSGNQSQLDKVSKDTSKCYLIVFVHGLLGSSFDFHQYRNHFKSMLFQLGIPLSSCKFLNSSSYEDDTFEDIDSMADLLVVEIVAFIESIQEQTLQSISFVCHSLGGIIARCAFRKPALKKYFGLFNTFVTLGSPHFSLALHQNMFITSAMGVYQAISRSKCIDQLNLREHSDPRQTLLYQLASDSSIQNFKHIFLYGSRQDKYVPYEGTLGLRLSTSEKPSVLQSGLNSSSNSTYSTKSTHAANSYNEHIKTILDEISQLFHSSLAQVANVHRYEVHFNHLEDAENIGTLFSSDMLGRKAHLSMIDDPGMVDMVVLCFLLRFPASDVLITHDSKINTNGMLDSH
ncbi:hypothetical protein O5D80_000775 [Batrachochytrium dendrobatidis]|nr:hypothetical protein O5D80_000775 [Batrachochytrium dendrobatidis]